MRGAQVIVVRVHGLGELHQRLAGVADRPGVRARPAGRVGVPAHQDGQRAAVGRLRLPGHSPRDVQGNVDGYRQDQETGRHPRRRQTEAGAKAQPALRRGRGRSGEGRWIVRARRGGKRPEAQPAGYPERHPRNDDAGRTDRQERVAALRDACHACDDSDQRRNDDAEDQLLTGPGDGVVGVRRGCDRGRHQHDQEERVVRAAVLVGRGIEPHPPVEDRQADKGRDRTTA